MTRKRRKKHIKIKKSQNLILIFIAILFLIPLIWLVLASIDPHASQALKIPETISLDNFKNILNDAKNQRGFINSIIISVTQTIIVVIASLLAAYPLSRFNFKNGQKITMGMLFLTSLPITAVMVPVYQLFIIFNLVDSMVGTILFLSASALPYGIWMSKNFLDGISIEVEEAAWMDGASSMQSLIRVVLPLMIPGVFTVAIFTFIGSWSNFFVPYILLQSTDKLPASVNIYRFFGARGGVMYGQLAAYSIIYILPAFALYSLAQKYMSQGFSMGGATKG